MEDCSICLCEIEKDHVIKKLSCGHIFHHRCFIDMVFRNKNMFIPCPLCREINTNIDKPLKTAEDNIRLLCSPKVGKVRCICNLKNGNRCKNKPVLMNYGKCYSHSKNILKK